MTHHNVFTDWHALACVASKSSKAVTISAERIIELDNAIQKTLQKTLDANELAWALDKFGEHARLCSWHDTPDSECNCGLSIILTRLARAVT